MAALRDWNLRLAPTLLQATEFWVGYRLYEKHGGYEKRLLPAMPLRLRRSMIPSVSVLPETHESCNGGNEQHRASCILVGLFFERLSESFKEWQAHRAAQELLTTIEDNATVPKLHKKGKKKHQAGNHLPK